MTATSSGSRVPRILLSVPHMGGQERRYANEAFDLNWVSTAGPNLAAFEAAFTRRLGVPSVCLSSGTAAIHLGLRLLGVGPGDEVFCSDLTFAASANPIRYLGAEPVFIDSDRATWNMDPEILSERSARQSRAEQPPQSHRRGASLRTVRRHGSDPRCLPPVRRAGSRRRGRGAGSHLQRPAGGHSRRNSRVFIQRQQDRHHHRRRHAGRSRSGQVEKARFWSTQARDPGIAYEHSELGYNYRMSNVLAGIGRGQLEVLDLRVEQRRAIAFRYRDAFADLPGISFMPQAPYGLSHQLAELLSDRCGEIRMLARLPHSPFGRRGHRIATGVEANAPPTPVLGLRILRRRRFTGPARARHLPAKLQLPHRRGSGVCGPTRQNRRRRRASAGRIRRNERPEPGRPEPIREAFHDRA